MDAIILAGGKGERLRPYTQFIPKVLMPLKDKSVIEFLIDELLNAGCARIFLALGEEADYIETFIRMKPRYKGKVFFSREDTPLSTAGPIKLLEHEIKEDFFLLNGDILVDIDFAKLFEAHIQSQKMATIATFKEVLKTERWALRTDENGTLKSHTYHPRFEHTVCTGIFVFKPYVFNLIQKGEALTFPGLIDRITAAGHAVGTYSDVKDWVHLHRAENYEQALRFYELHTSKNGP